MAKRPCVRVEAVSMWTGASTQSFVSHWRQHRGRRTSDRVWATTHGYKRVRGGASPRAVLPGRRTGLAAREVSLHPRCHGAEASQK